MSQVPSGRRQELLALLLDSRAGLSADELAGRVGVSRSAVIQHLTALERDGYVRRGELVPTGGRPSRVYALTEQGLQTFPKQYSWFSALLLSSLKAELGEKRLAHHLRAMAADLARDLAVNTAEEQDQQRLARLLDTMNRLHYQARADTSRGLGITASNCVYHDLVREHPEVCEFDLELLSTFMDMDVEHVECMARGGRVCRFAFSPKPTK